MISAKTIQIFLPTGDPQGLRTAEMTTRTVQVIDVPRKSLPDLKEMLEPSQVGVYYLVGERESGEPTVYVGHTGDLPFRLATHNREKDFWRRALVAVSRMNAMTQTHSAYIEWRSIAAVRDAARYADENGNSGGQPHTTPPLRAECEELFETIGPLLATLGHPMFDPVEQRTSDRDEPAAASIEYVCQSRDTDARGQYTSEGFVVLAGSSGRSETADYADRVRQERAALLEHGTAEESDGRFRLTKTHLFNSPSAAASVMVGKSSNGWITWLTPDGRTLDEVERR